jgi:hypothetical protein
MSSTSNPPALIHVIRWIRDLAGVTHAIRESEDEHHVTICGRYKCGQSSEEASGNLCMDCVRSLRQTVTRSDGRTDPESVRRGSIGQTRRHNGRMMP